MLNFSNIWNTFLIYVNLLLAPLSNGGRFDLLDREYSGGFLLLDSFLNSKQGGGVYDSI